ncbi:TPA: MFS transporter permease [Streptococcus pneumoniae]|uniref:MFS transporter permease n=1 Tax=Streptococcus pneumoniae TaxID=1313 RepID=UPI0005E9D962|nr:MFS transporter permease [Streptococcus pneumoniae]MBW7557014.1 MFS transporter permease [Streptococcus pneumoniae]MBW8168991.1 MFS transporter permease [Streptococcus pneumoniae]MDV8187860.1 MFS transporter permease [Streptococcus pneumoniae]MDV8301488.1 MFS transporter permease [Streptococcus pneumoniae]MDV8652529.1 MFS transporter permease [Streptococcus pneumoniae]
MKLFWTNNIYRQLLLNSCFSSFGDSIFYLAIINYVAQYNFAPLAILLISISEMVPLLSQLFLGILGDFQENRVKHALWIAKIKILLYAILTVFLVLSPFSLVSVIMIVIINLISDTLSYLSAYMMNALYISVIKDDLHDAMGFRQSLMRVVRIVANLAGAFLINTLTFVIAFLGLYVIRHTLYEVEKRIEMSHTALSFKKYFQHLKQSLAVLLRLKDTVILLFLTTSMIAILDVSPRLIALRFIQQTLAQLSIGQLLALLSIIMSCGAILGNMTSSNLFKNIRFTHLLVFCEISLLTLITSILCQAYIVIFMTSFISSTIIGILSPRLQAAVFAHIPSDKMGTVGSALSTVDILAPSLLSLLALSIASGVSVQLASIFLYLILIALIFCQWLVKFNTHN